MSPDQIFSIANPIAVIGWLLLAFLPRRRWATFGATAIAVLFAIAYTVIVAAVFAGAAGGFSSLSDVALLFTNRWMLLAGWIHYLAFDLLVGAWEVRDSQRRGLPHLLVVPCLFLTFMFGPAGWLLYVALRSRWAPREVQNGRIAESRD
jgi:hypothetical protein